MIEDRDRSPSLALDHVTLAVPDMTEAGDILWERFGLRLTATPGSEGTHGRVYLDRAYIEVAPSGDDHADSGLALPSFFLSHPDVPAAIEALRAAGLAHAPASTYHGVDGVWWDGTPAAPPGIPAPVLVQRISPEALAADWPPPLTAPHPSGIERLAAVYIVTPYVAEAVEFYLGLIGALAGEVAAGQAASHTTAGKGRPFALSDQQWEIRLPGGGLLIICDPLRSGRARDHLLTAGPGVAGIELATSQPTDALLRLDLGQVAYHLSEDERGMCFWIDAGATPGIAVVLRVGTR